MSKKIKGGKKGFEKCFNKEYYRRKKYAKRTSFGKTIQKGI